MLLTTTQVDFFKQHGYLHVQNLVGSEYLDPIVAVYKGLMKDNLRQWIAEGKMDPKTIDLPFTESLVAAYAAGCDYFQTMDISLPAEGIQPDTPMFTGPEVFKLMVADPVLDTIESLIGPEITSSPIQHVRIKPPSKFLDKDEQRSHIAHTSWHQDRGVAMAEADSASMVTAWVAVTDANEENGCLRVLEDTQDSPLLTHCPQPQMGIPDALIDESKAKYLEVKSGDALFFHPMTIHGAGPNRSDRLRWSFDLRYIKTGEPTGRPLFPDFVARSRKDPSSQLRDPKKWAQMWDDARTQLSGKEGLVFHRWDQSAPACA